MNSLPTLTVTESFKPLSTFSIGPDGLTSDFEKFELERLRHSYGFEAYKEVLNCLKNHFIRSVKQYSIQYTSELSSVRLKKFNELLAPFSYWEIWSSSEYCSFSTIEIAVINACRKKASMSAVAFATDLSTPKLNSILYKITRKLKISSTQDDYNWWLCNQHHMLDRKELFLNAPINTLKNSIPIRILSVLSYVGDTLKEILSKVTEEELLTMKRMGKKGLAELKVVLAKYECLDQLRQI